LDDSEESLTILLNWLSENYASVPNRFERSSLKATENNFGRFVDRDISIKNCLNQILIRENFRKNEALKNNPGDDKSLNAIIGTGGPPGAGKSEFLNEIGNLISENKLKRNEIDPKVVTSPDEKPFQSYLPILVTFSQFSSLREGEIGLKDTKKIAVRMIFGFYYDDDNKYAKYDKFSKSFLEAFDLSKFDVQQAVALIELDMKKKIARRRKIFCYY